MLFLDKAAGLGITGGGIAVILAVLGILAFIVVEAYPLFRGARADRTSVTKLAESGPLLVGIDEYRELAYGVWAAPGIRFFDPALGRETASVPLDSLSGCRITAAARAPHGDRLALGTDDGRILLANVDFAAEFGSTGARTIRADVEEKLILSWPGLSSHVRQVSHAGWEGGSATFATMDSCRYLLWLEEVKTSLLGDATRDISRFEIDARSGDRITCSTLTGDGRRLFLGLESGAIQLWDLSGPRPLMRETIEPGNGDGARITSLAMALGDRTVIVGDSRGRLRAWFEVTDPIAGGNAKRHELVHEFPPHDGAITLIQPSSRDRRFLSADEKGTIRLQYLTTERVLLRIAVPNGVESAVLAPKADGVLAAGKDGSLSDFVVVNPHPEITLRTLFGKIWYEGYDRPEYVWQSTGGSDEFEGKFSLIPLLFGTLKGTLYALLFAVPIALLAAIYASQFLHHRIRNILKPTIEIMAALPSVVLGLIAGLFLAPALEEIVPGTLLAVLLLPLLFLASAIIWRSIPSRITGRVPAGTEVLLLIPIVVLGWVLSQALGPVAERHLFGGDFRLWLHEGLQVRYDQRNSLVVGFAMGFAVIPIIFTICEDSLSAVPQHLISGSIACGASRWQTALLIVLPAAGSGIFSAVMVGFGRAVGETMIVLMATGNTPIMDWSVFNGMRTLSANIATEIPEAPYRGTLYRILFFSGLLLFTLTFLLNTAAEMIRQRLRRKFGNY